MKTESGLVAFCYMSDQYEVALFSEPPTDPLYNDMFPVVRLSDAEATIAKLRDALSETEAYHKRMVAAKDVEIERLKQTPTIEEAKTTVEHLRAYASDNGYSHGDYADVMTEAANQIEKQAERIKELESEILEQCRINGMGAEREAALLGQIERQSAALKLAKEALIGALSDDQPYINASKEALAAIDALDTNLEPTPPVSEDWKDANQARIEELELLAHNLGRGLIRWREREWPGTDQAHVVYREYPALKAIDAAMQEDKP